MAHNSNFLSIGRSSLQDLHAALLLKIRDKALDPADVDGFINSAPGASLFAVALCGADSGAGCAQGIVAANRLRRSFKITKTDAADKFRRVRSRRAGIGTWRIVAEQTTLSLFHDRAHGVPLHKFL